MSLVNAVREYHQARTLAADAAASLKAAKEFEEQAKQNLLAIMVEEGTSSVDVEDLGKFSMVTTTYMSVTAANKAQFYPYLKESGNAGLLKEDVNPRTLSAFLKEHLIELTNKNIEQGMDQFEAKEKAVLFLGSQGVDSYSEKNVAFRKL